jgi:hypothetical protein
MEEQVKEAHPCLNPVYLEPEERGERERKELENSRKRAQREGMLKKHSEKERYRARDHHL